MSEQAAPRPATIRAMTTQPGTDAGTAAAWTCPRCWTLVLSEHTTAHEDWHARSDETFEATVRAIAKIETAVNRLRGIRTDPHINNARRTP